MAGHIGKLLYGVPHVITAHSLEPHRPWKAEQLGGGYRLSSWAERTAYEGADAMIAVSDGMRSRHPGQLPGAGPGEGARDPQRHRHRDLPPRPGDATSVGAAGVDPDRRSSCSSGGSPGRRASATWSRRPTTSTRTCSWCSAPARPDTPEIAAETEPAVAELHAARPGVFWVRRMLPPPEVRQVLSAATVFVCPSVYEPLGIVNLEAMACGTAVVASDVGGIPEVVDDGETGPAGALRRARRPSEFAPARGAVNTLLADPARGGGDGRGRPGAGRATSSPGTAAQRTVEIYQLALRPAASARA